MLFFTSTTSGYRRTVCTNFKISTDSVIELNIVIQSPFLYNHTTGYSLIISQLRIYLYSFFDIITIIVVPPNKTSG